MSTIIVDEHNNIILSYINNIIFNYVIFLKPYIMYFIILVLQI